MRLLMRSENIAPLCTFVSAVTRLVEKASNEAELLRNGKVLLQQLIATDSWLSDFCAQPHAEHYHQYLIHADPLERFSVVSFAWGRGQNKPVHDHKMWWLSGMLRGGRNEYELRA
jgi:predicted metal-dependent enzyme (double-stranded beta helix superfamily)